MSAPDPEPWTVLLDLVDEGDINVASEGFPNAGFLIARMDVREDPEDFDTPPREEALANARIFAASREMLASLKELLSRREAACAKRGYRPVDGHDGRYARARAAIEKAEKGTP